MFTKHSMTRVFVSSLNFTLGLVLLIGSVAFPTTARAFSNTIQVDTLADTTVADSHCSLREAITNADDNALTYPECLYGAGGLVIAFSTALGTGTITLTSPLPAITHTGGLIVDGGSHITISGNNLYREFVVNSGVTFTLRNLTVTNGRAIPYCSSGDPGWGAGVLNYGTVNILNSTISNNNAISNAGCAGYGGGIYNHGGSLAILNSTLSGNNAGGYGGAVYNSAGTATISGSTMLSNTAGSDFGGGGIFNVGTLILTNNTLAGNSASGLSGGGLYNYAGTATLTNNTLAFNSASSGGDIYNDTAATLNLYNNILANSAGGGDCFNNSGTVSGNHNINEDAANGCGLAVGPGQNTVGLDPGLSSLYAWQPPAYFPLLAGSIAIDAGDDTKCAAAPVNNSSQNGLARPQGAHCDIGSYERDVTPPWVSSIARVNPDPTSAGSVQFTVTFTEPVSGVDPSDFVLTTTGSISGAAVSGAVGSGAVATVTVSTGMGNGTIRLDVLDDDSILDAGSNPLGGVGSGNGVFTSGPFYTVVKTLSFNSTGAQDGWILESAENSGVGGTLNAPATTFVLGDDASNRQYRAILSFNTAGLPDAALIQSAVLKIKPNGAPVGTNPFAVLGKLLVDIRSGPFGTSPALQLSDFNAAASVDKVGAFGATPAGGWYSVSLNASGRGQINRLGLTQLRLRFALDDNNNNAADLMRFVSGDAANPPMLVITFTQ